jgi:hypothetical protein
MSGVDLEKRISPDLPKCVEAKFVKISDLKVNELLVMAGFQYLHLQGSCSPAANMRDPNPSTKILTRVERGSDLNDLRAKFHRLGYKRIANFLEGD